MVSKDYFLIISLSKDHIVLSARNNLLENQSKLLTPIFSFYFKTTTTANCNLISLYPEKSNQFISPIVLPKILPPLHQQLNCQSSMFVAIVVVTQIEIFIRCGLAIIFVKGGWRGGWLVFRVPASLANGKKLMMPGGH